MSFTATGVRKRNLDTDRLQNLINADEQGFIQRMKPFNSESPSRGLQIGQGGGQQPNLAADLFTTFGKGINGAIGYVQGAVEVAVGDTIDFFHDATEDIFSSYLKIVNAGVGKVVDIFNGGDFPGQILKLQGDDTDTVTINNANDPGNTTGNVILPGVGASMTLAVEQLTEFVFDPLKNINGHTGAWRLASEATAGGGTLPSGTAVNDHLEWNGVSWDASQNLEFNATGPFADSGFLRFPNDNIMLSARNQLNDGNLELKIDSSDNFDFTESNNAPVILQLRAQHASAPDQLGTIEQQSNVTGEMVLRTPDGFSINIGGAPTATFAALAATGIEFFDFLDMSGNQVQDLTALVYTGFTGDGKSISRFATGIDYDIENSAHEHLFRVNGNPPADVFSIKDGFVELSGTNLASSGKIRFANTAIMLSSRTFANDGNVEFKVDNSDFFDFTDSSNGAVSLSLRAQDAVVADKIGSLTQFGTATGHLQLATGTKFDFVIGGDTQISIAPLADTGIELFDFLDMSGNQIQDLTALVYDGFTGNGKSISRFATGINYDIENAAHDHVFRVNGNPPNTQVTISDGSMILGTDLFIEFDERVGDPTVGANKGVLYAKDVGGNTQLFFDNNTEAPVNLTTVSSGANTALSNLAAVAVNVAMDINGNNLLNCAILQSADAQVADNGTLRLGNAQSIQWRNAANTGNATFNYDSFDDFVFNFNALTGTANYLINAIDDVVVRLRSENDTIGEGAGFFIFEGDNASAITHEYARITAIIRDPTAALEDGSFSFNVHQAGANITYLSLRGDNQEIDMFKALAMNTNPVIEIDFIALTEKASDPPVIANEGVLYTKDVSGNTQLFYDNNTEAPVNLSTGGGSIPHLDGEGATDIIRNTATATKTLRFDLGDKASGDTTFHILGSTGAVVNFPNVSTANVAVTNFNNSFSATQNFGGAGNGLTCTTAAFFNDDVTLGNATGDLIATTGRFATDLDPSTNGTRDFGFDTLRWRILYLQEFTDIEEGFASGVAPVGTTDDAKIFCRPNGTDTELRVKFQTGDSVLLAIEPP